MQPARYRHADDTQLPRRESGKSESGRKAAPAPGLCTQRGDRGSDRPLGRGKMVSKPSPSFLTRDLDAECDGFKIK